MQTASIRLATAGLTFILGLSAYLVWSTFYGSPPLESRIDPLSRSKEEEWHRLYEAAGMTGDPQILHRISDKLLCANADGISDAYPIEVNGRAWCKKEDNTIEGLTLGGYGEFHRKIIAEHRTWVLKNMAFVESVSSSIKAKDYISKHKL